MSPDDKKYRVRKGQLSGLCTDGDGNAYLQGTIGGSKTKFSLSNSNTVFVVVVDKDEGIVMLEADGVCDGEIENKLEQRGRPCSLYAQSVYKKIDSGKTPQDGDDYENCYYFEDVDGNLRKKCF